jgi:hypothetical protein
MKINLHIERLVLDGMPIDRTQGGKLRAAVEQELTRLLAGGLAQQLRQGGAVPVLRGGRIRIQKSTNAGALGRDIARTLHQGISNSSPPKRHAGGLIPQNKDGVNLQR